MARNVVSKKSNRKTSLVYSDSLNAVERISQTRFGKSATPLRKFGSKEIANTVCEIDGGKDLAITSCQIQFCMMRLLSLLGVLEYGRFAA